MTNDDFIHIILRLRTANRSFKKWNKFMLEKRSSSNKCIIVFHTGLLFSVCLRKINRYFLNALQKSFHTVLFVYKTSGWGCGFFSLIVIHLLCLYFCIRKISMIGRQPTIQNLLRLDFSSCDRAQKSTLETLENFANNYHPL